MVKHIYLNEDNTSNYKITILLLVYFLLHVSAVAAIKKDAHMSIYISNANDFNRVAIFYSNGLYSMLGQIGTYEVHNDTIILDNSHLIKGIFNGEFIFNNNLMPIAKKDNHRSLYFINKKDSIILHSDGHEYIYRNINSEERSRHTDFTPNNYTANTFKFNPPKYSYKVVSYVANLGFLTPVYLTMVFSPDVFNYFEYYIPGIDCLVIGVIWESTYNNYEFNVLSFVRDFMPIFKVISISNNLNIERLDVLNVNGEFKGLNGSETVRLLPFFMPYKIESLYTSNDDALSDDIHHYLVTSANMNIASQPYVDTQKVKNDSIIFNLFSSLSF